jgi:hypothetical protein
MKFVLALLLVISCVLASVTEAGTCHATAVGGHGSLAFLCKTNSDCQNCGDGVSFKYVYCDTSFGSAVCHFNNDEQGVPSSTSSLETEAETSFLRRRLLPRRVRDNN